MLKKSIEQKRITDSHTKKARAESLGIKEFVQKIKSRKELSRDFLDTFSKMSVEQFSGVLEEIKSSPALDLQIYEWLIKRMISLQMDPKELSDLLSLVKEHYTPNITFYNNLLKTCNIVSNHDKRDTTEKHISNIWNEIKYSNFNPNLETFHHLLQFYSNTNNSRGLVLLHDVYKELEFNKIELDIETYELLFRVLLNSSRLTGSKFFKEVVSQIKKNVKNPMNMVEKVVSDIGDSIRITSWALSCAIWLAIEFDLEDSVNLLINNKREHNVHFSSTAIFQIAHAYYDKENYSACLKIIDEFQNDHKFPDNIKSLLLESLSRLGKTHEMVEKYFSFKNQNSTTVFSSNVYEKLLESTKDDQHAFEQIWSDMIDNQPNLNSLKISHAFFREKGDQTKVEEVLQKITDLEMEKKSSSQRRLYSERSANSHWFLMENAKE